MLRKNSSNLRCFSVFSSWQQRLFKIIQFLGNFLRSILCEDGPSFPIFYPIVFSHVELALIGFQLLLSLRFKHTLRLEWCVFWISSFQILDLHVVLIKMQFSLNWIFTNNSLSSSSLKMFSEISSIRIEISELFRTGFSVTLQTHTNTVLLTFLWHRFCSTDHKTFLSV